MLIPFPDDLLSSEEVGHHCGCDPELEQGHNDAVRRLTP